MWKEKNHQMKFYEITYIIEDEQYKLQFLENEIDKIEKDWQEQK